MHVTSSLNLFKGDSDHGKFLLFTFEITFYSWLAFKFDKANIAWLESSLKLMGSLGMLINNSHSNMNINLELQHNYIVNFSKYYNEITGK